MRERRAVVLGSNGPLSDLQYAFDDSIKVAKLLRSEDYGFQVTEIPPNSDKWDCLKKISEVAEACKADDTLIFYFSGHGWRKPSTCELFLSIDTTEKTDIVFSSLKISAVTEIFNDCKARNKLLILDCCHAGAIGNSQKSKSGDSDRNDNLPTLQGFFKSQSYRTLAASPDFLKTQEIEINHKGEILRGGFLTVYLCLGLTEKFAEVDTDRDGFISVEDLRDWLVKQAEKYNSEHRPQHPIPPPGTLGEGYNTGSFHINIKAIGKEKGDSFRSKQNISPTQIDSPTGWLSVDQKFLDERGSLNPNDACKYFDGRLPRWREAMEPEIPKMKIVEQVIAYLEDNRIEKHLGVMIILGATSEGKTTALMQIVVKLIQEKPGWNIVWNNGRNTFLNRNFIKQIAQTSKSYLIVSDDAELIAESVFREVKFLRRENRSNIQFLLCCRDTDWLAIEANKWNWIDHALFREETVRGYFDADFAAKLITAWETYDSLGKLQEYPQKSTMIQKLMECAQSATHQRGGTLLGAMLRVRYDNEGFKKHIQTLIDGLRQKKAPGGSLLDAFAFVAFPHADVNLEVPKRVLAQILGCDENELQRKVINLLGEEAATGSTTKFVFTRDSDIAKVATEIMIDSGEFDRDTIYTKLVKSAFEAKKLYGWVDKLDDWQYLFSKFFKRGSEYHGIGVRLAQTVFENIEDKGAKLRSLVTLSRLYREAGYPEDSVQVFRVRAESLEMDRPTYHEWGTAEKRNKKPTLGAWLGGFALSDQIRIRLDKKTASICLSGLSTTFSELHDKYGDRVFIQACGAAAQLGLTEICEPSAKTKDKNYVLEPDSESTRNLTVSLAKSKPLYNQCPLKNIEQLQAGIIAAWQQPEDNLPECITPANQLTFENLAQMLGILNK